MHSLIVREVRGAEIHPGVSNWAASPFQVGEGTSGNIVAGVAGAVQISKTTPLTAVIPPASGLEGAGTVG